MARTAYNGFDLEVDVLKKMRHQLDRLSTLAARERVTRMVLESVRENGVAPTLPAPAPLSAEERTIPLPLPAADINDPADLFK